jgi:hypothetical protein
MKTTFFASIVLMLSAIALASPADARNVVVRQSTTGDQTTDPCPNYSLMANLSTIGANSSYRSFFFAKSSTGSLADQRMFSQAILALPAMTADVALNAQCGNLTQVALTEAERNLTLGIVGPFSGLVAEGIQAGPEVIAIVGVIIVIFAGVWCFQP